MIRYCWLISLFFFQLGLSDILAVEFKMTNPPSAISQEEFEIGVSLSGAKKATNYFKIYINSKDNKNVAKTWNGSLWQSTGGGKNYFPVEIIDNTQEIKILGKVDPKDIEEQSYELFVKRYTASGAVAESTEKQKVDLSALVIKNPDQQRTIEIEKNASDAVLETNVNTVVTVTDKPNQNMHDKKDDGFVEESQNMPIVLGAKNQMLEGTPKVELDQKLSTESPSRTDTAKDGAFIKANVEENRASIKSFGDIVFGAVFVFSGLVMFFVGAIPIIMIFKK